MFLHTCCILFIHMFLNCHNTYFRCKYWLCLYLIQLESVNYVPPKIVFSWIVYMFVCLKCCICVLNAINGCIVLYCPSVCVSNLRCTFNVYYLKAKNTSPWYTLRCCADPSKLAMICIRFHKMSGIYYAHQRRSI